MAIKSSWKKTFTFMALELDVPEAWVRELGWRFMAGGPPLERDAGPGARC